VDNEQRVNNQATRHQWSVYRD